MTHESLHKDRKEAPAGTGTTKEPHTAVPGFYLFPCCPYADCSARLTARLMVLYRLGNGAGISTRTPGPVLFCPLHFVYVGIDRRAGLTIEGHNL